MLTFNVPVLPFKLPTVISPAVAVRFPVRLRMPPLTVVLPVWMFAPDKVSVPVPDFLMLPVATAPFTMLVVEPITPLRVLVVPLPAKS